MEANLPLPSTCTLISVLEARMITVGSSYTESKSWLFFIFKLCLIASGKYCALKSFNNSVFAL